MKPKYLVRPDDHQIFDLDESNGCYRPLFNTSVTDRCGNRPRAHVHYSYHNLVNSYGFFSITENELDSYVEKNNNYHSDLNEYNKSNGHGGIKLKDHNLYDREKLELHMNQILNAVLFNPTVKNSIRDSNEVAEYVTEFLNKIL